MNLTLQKIIFVIGLLFTAICIYILNSLYPVYADDWVYSLFYEVNPHRPLNGVLDLIVSQYNHYMLWGGRSVAHTIAQFLLLFDPVIQDVFNTIAFLFFVILMYKLSNVFHRKKTNGVLLFFLVCMLWIFTDSMLFSAAIWITGAANYLWTSLILLLFIYPFFKFLFSETNTFNKGKLFSFSFIILAFLSGWTNENSIFAVFFFLVCFFFLCKKMSRKIPALVIYSTFAFIIGVFVMFLAPGNYKRLSGASDEVGHIPDGFFDFIIFKIGDLFHTLHITYTLYLTAFIILLIAAYLILKKGKVRNDNKLVMVGLLVAMSYISAASMVGAPYISYRTIFFTNVLLVIASGILFLEIFVHNKLMQVACILLTILLLLFSSYDYSKKYITLNFVSTLWKERDVFIEEQKSIGNKNIVFPTTFTVHPKFLLNEMNPDPKDSRNTFYSKYKGVDSIRSDSSAVMLKTP